MATRSQITTWFQDHRDQVITFVKNNKDGPNFRQIKRLEDRTDAQVHVYGGPLGHGWSVLVKATEGEDVYNRIVHFGPEDRPDDSGWVLYQDDLPNQGD
ncbi:MAG: hypothetical protein DRP09_10920 [Candidatus Thorarchaeota archaeon]|nr:MAG: hypothetical protein DRP09_10920 [Candidatus Thorarchaeota archaeon]